MRSWRALPSHTSYGVSSALFVFFAGLFSLHKQSSAKKEKKIREEKAKVCEQKEQGRGEDEAEVKKKM